MFLPQYEQACIFADEVELQSGGMTRNQQIEELLSQVPKGATPQVVDFLRALANRKKIMSHSVKKRSKSASVAQRTFGMIPADAATVRQALSEDLYGLE
jgi:2-C-methyl-D-erythritol 4-phosphate cytidylyltransferase